MIKKLIFTLATIGLIANVTGCTTNKAQDETEIVENADVDKIDAETSAVATDGTNAVATDDASLQAALGETTAPPTIEPSLDGAAPATDVATTPNLDTPVSPDIASAPTLDESSLNDIPPPTDPSVMALTETPMVTDTPAATEVAPAPLVEASNETPATETPVASYTPEASPLSESTPVSVPSKPAGSQLKKVAATIPYQSGAGWVNTVYVARPGEKLKGISETIFGADKSKDLKKISGNNYLKNRSVKAGDKIYYVSPHRPDDSTKMLMYYEDVGMMPETYTAAKGDRLKKVSKKLLGYDNAWVEMWTANPVESKDRLAEGEVLKYWKSASTISTPAPTTPSLASNTSAAMDQGAGQLIDQAQMPTAPPAHVPPPPPAEIPGPALAQNTPPPPDMNSMPPPPPADMPAPPPPDMNAGAGMEPPPPPPPDMNAPPPPPPHAGGNAAAGTPGGAKKKFAPGAEEEPATIGGLDQDTLMSLGAVGVLTVALAFVLISRRRKKRLAEQSMTEHNVGT